VFKIEKKKKGSKWRYTSYKYVLNGLKNFKLRVILRQLLINNFRKVLTPFL